MPHKHKFGRFCCHRFYNADLNASIGDLDSSGSNTLWDTNFNWRVAPLTFIELFFTQFNQPFTYKQTLHTHRVVVLGILIEGSAYKFL